MAKSRKTNEAPGTSRQTPTRSSSQQRTSTPSGSAKRKNATPRKSTTATQREERRRRYRPGMKALREIRQMQSSTSLCIRRLPFSRLVREIQMKLNPRITQWNVNALAALQEACEAYLVHFFEDCQMAATFANRVTVMQKDMHFVMKLKGKSGM